jgi:hypothetical protein
MALVEVENLELSALWREQDRRHGLFPDSRDLREILSWEVFEFLGRLALNPDHKG